MREHDDKIDRIPSECRSDADLGEYGNIEVHAATAEGPNTILKADAPIATARAQRRELITAVRAGQHLELTVTARTYRQRKGQPNRRFLRFATDQLDAIAASFAGQPFLLDHNTYEQRARKGTILKSELVTDSRGMSAFDMTFSVVKPDAVISLLDGTLDRFSIGWFPTGPVLCSVHRTDVRDPKGCQCWPGDTVEVDGKPQIVEYEFSNAEGKELSGVNVPAVRGTRIDDIRAALAVELSLPPKAKERVMAFPRSNALLGFELSEAGDERLAAFIEGMQREHRAENRALVQERDQFRTRLTDAENTIKAVTASASKARIDVLIDGAYASGRLKYGRDEAGKAVPSKREARLRTLAARDGVDALADEIAELDVVVPVGERQLTAAITEPERTETGVYAPEDNPYLAVAARELGIPIEQLKANAKAFGTGVAR